MQAIRVLTPRSPGFFPINLRARHQHYVADRPLSAAPDCGLRVHCYANGLRTTAAPGARFHFPIQPRRRTFGFTGRGGNVQHSPVSDRRCIPGLSSRVGHCANAADFSSRRVNMRTGPRVGLVLGSRQDMRCVFIANATGEQYTYRGTIRRVGVDIGVTRGGRLFWAVFARNSQIGRGTLRGSYVGASGNVAVGLGLGAKVLIGGSRRTITLQPLSIEGQIGINLALGVTNLVLR